jgi:hypothetical protein
LVIVDYNPPKKEIKEEFILKLPKLDDEEKSVKD